MVRRVDGVSEGWVRSTSGRYKWGFRGGEIRRGTRPNDFDSHPHLDIAARFDAPTRVLGARLPQTPSPLAACPHPRAPSTSQWNTPTTTNAIPCSVPSSDLPADRGVTYELGRRMHNEGMAANIEQLDRCAPDRQSP